MVEIVVDQDRETAVDMGAAVAEGMWLAQIYEDPDGT